MELSAFAHMTKRDIKVVQPGLVYVIEWRAGAQVETSASGSSSTGSGLRETGSGSTLGVTTAEGEVQSPRRRSPRTPGASASASASTSGSASASGATAKEVRRVKTGRGYYVVEEVSSDEEEGDEAEGGDAERGGEKGREEEEEGGGPTVYVA